MARGLAAVPGVDLTVVVNVGDDAFNHGLNISPDLDTVTYTLAGVEGPQGWGRADDTFILNTELGRFGVDNTFQLGDRDLALKLFRTNELANGARLSEVTEAIARAFDVSPTILPATDDPLRTMVRTADGWLTFQEYFVNRRHEDDVVELRFEGEDDARGAPGVLEAIGDADMVIVGPSNPPLSIWPILAIDEVRSAVAAHPSVTAVSPLIGGKTVKGPADRVLAGLGLPAGNRGVAVAYEGLLHRLVIDTSDRDDASSMGAIGIHVTPTLIKEPEAATRLATELVGL